MRRKVALPAYNKAGQKIYITLPQTHNEKLEFKEEWKIAEPLAEIRKRHSGLQIRVESEKEACRVFN